MVAKQAGQAAGGFAGGFFNNPGVVAAIGIIAAIAIPLLIFRKNIADFFAEGIKFPDINLPTINLPDITFPSFDFGGLFEGFNPFPNATAGGEPVPLSQPGEGLPNPADAPTDPTPVDILLGEGETDPRIINPEAFDPELAPQLFDPTQFQPPVEGTSGEPTVLEPTQPGGGGGVPIEDELEVIFTPFIPPSSQEGAITVGEESALGGGPSFEGGTTTFGNLNEIVDTLSEVLQIFPSLTASQARDALQEFFGLTFGQFALINPDVVNISDGA